MDMTEHLELLSRYNPWNGNAVPCGFRRDFYLSKIKAFSGNSLVKVLTGQRRAGKSYILRQVMMDLISDGVADNNLLYVSKEYTSFDFIRSYTDLDDIIREYREHLKPEGKTYIFIDEIQNVEGWEKVVNSISQDFTAPCEVFISGSNSKMLSGELATLLSGRYVECEILPLSYEEWIGANMKDAGMRSYEEYLHESGLPEMLHLSAQEIRRHYVSSLKDTVLLRDIVERHKIRDVNTLDDLFVYLVNNATKLFTPSTIVKYYKGKGKTVNYETVTAYLTYLTETYLVHRAERYNIQGKETISGNCKYYINDLAFHNYLYRGFAYGYGYELENLVYLDLRRAGYDVYVGNVHDSAEARMLEVDFVGVQGDNRIYVQVSYKMDNPETMKREYDSLEQIKDNYPKYVVTMDEFRFPSKDGITHVQAWDFHKELAKISY